MFDVKHEYESTNHTNRWSSVQLHDSFNQPSIMVLSKYDGCVFTMREEEDRWRKQKECKTSSL